MIGDLSDIGTEFRRIASIHDTAYDCPQQVPKDKWNYWDGKHFAQAGSTDIIIQCAGKKENNQRETFDSQQLAVRIPKPQNPKTPKPHEGIELI